MSNSWGHLCGPMPRDQLLERARWEGQQPTRTGAGYQPWPTAWLACACKRPCLLPATHAVAYNYVTGRLGRTGQSRSQRCPACAERFAKKHGLDFQPATATAEEIIKAYEANTHGLMWGQSLT